MRDWLKGGGVGETGPSGYGCRRHYSVVHVPRRICKYDVEHIATHSSLMQIIRFSDDPTRRLPMKLFFFFHAKPLFFFISFSVTLDDFYKCKLNVKTVFNFNICKINSVITIIII